MVQADFDEELLERVQSSIEIHETLLSKSLDSYIGAIELTFDILPVYCVDGEASIPVGVKSDASGISKMTDNSIVCFVQNSKIIGMQWVGKIKKYIKKNVKDLDSFFSVELNTMAIKVKLKNIIL